MPDIAIPIVFPDYLIAVNTPRTTIDIPDLIPGFDVLPDNVEIPATNNRIPDLGHAGILFLNGKTGTTKYYEYGRYSGPKGQTRKIRISDVKMNGQGHPTSDSLSYTLSQISSRTGQGGRISAAYIPVPGKYPAMLAYCLKRMQENRDPNRQEYDLFDNSCNHFMQGVLVAAGVNVPDMIDRRPTSYIEELRDDYQDLDYDPRSGKGTTIESAEDNAGWFGRFLGQPAGL